MHGFSPEFQDWVTRARETDIVETARRLGARLKRQGREWAGPCPRCGGDSDKLSISPDKKVFVCGHVGGEGGDVIALAQHIKEIEFVAACEDLTGEPPPRGEPAERDPELERERRDERRDRDMERVDADLARRERKISVAESLWDRCIPILGTHADAYLRRRRIRLLPEQTLALRFCPALPFQGYRDAESDTEEELGIFPAMVAAITDPDGNIVGAHRTYLDPEQPAKLVPPGDRKRNKAKKVLGTAKGGAIWLGPPREVIAMGEGIETTLSWFALGQGPDEMTPVAGVSLGNMAGKPTAWLPHPTRAKRQIPNGEPDLDDVAVAFPSEVKQLILLGDGDSDAAWTCGMMMTALRRAQRTIPIVQMHMAPAGEDWSDVRMREVAA